MLRATQLWVFNDGPGPGPCEGRGWYDPGLGSSFLHREDTRPSPVIGGICEEEEIGSSGKVLLEEHLVVKKAKYEESGNGGDSRGSQLGREGRIGGAQQNFMG